MLSNEKLAAYRGLLKLFIFIALGFVFYVFIKAFSVNDSNQHAEGLKIDLASLSPGEYRFADWSDARVLILHRTDAMLHDIERIEDNLHDATSRFSIQPAYATGRFRSIKKNYLVVTAKARDTDCEVAVMPLRENTDADNWRGGLFDACNGARYDYAGRVLKNQRAQLNLTIPPHQFIAGDGVFLGSR